MIGYTGTNFDRPDFIRMKNDIEKGKINLIITKDLSRLGRDYIDTGHYIERYFPAMGVRYIALNDGIDTGIRDSSNNEMGAFKSVVNDMYARDISKKVRTAKRTIAEKGLVTSGFAPYGYKKDPNNKNKFIVDEVVSDNVKYIFNEFINGTNMVQIARDLNDRKVDSPALYKKKTSNLYVSSLKYLWSHVPVRKILINRVYIGDLVQCKRENVNYKVKKRIDRKPEEYVIVENTHEQIIDRKSFELTQELIKARGHKKRRNNNANLKHLLSGLVYCPRCKSKYIFQRQNKTDNNIVLICGDYRKFGKGYCKRGAIKEEVIDRLVIDDLKEIAREKLNNDKLADIQDIKYLKNQQVRVEKQLSNNKTRVQEIERISKQCYEDRVNGIVTAEEYVNLMQEYKQEKEMLLKQVEQLEHDLKNQDNKTDEELKKTLDNILKFNIVNRNTIVSLIEKIWVIDSENIKIKYKFSK